MFIVSKAMLISSAAVIVRHLVEPLCNGVFSVCSAVTVVYPCSMGVFGMLAVMYGRRHFYSVCNY